MATVDVAPFSPRARVSAGPYVWGTRTKGVVTLRLNEAEAREIAEVCARTEVVRCALVGWEVVR